MDSTGNVLKDKEYSAWQRQREGSELAFQGKAEGVNVGGGGWNPA